jgi:tRNA G18 (ribose-2'-O)-methylase SpoU
MAVFVPMYGAGRSLNVHVAAAIVLYHILHTPGQ